jgi:flagellar hook-associated protein 2
MGLSIDGLVTGMNTTDTVNQLMQAEALPQTMLKTKVNTQNKVIASYQAINTKFLAMSAAANALGTAGTWQAVKATSSSDAAVVSTQAGAAPGTLSFKVESLAAAHMVTFADPGKSVANTADQILSGSTVQIKLLDGTFTDLTPTDGSLASVVSAINGAADSAYRAAAVQIAPGQYTLQLSAKSTGAAGDFPPPDGIDPAILGGGGVTTQGSDALLSIGTTNPYYITSSSNTFADVLPGVTVTATKVQKADDPAVTIGLAEDTAGIGDKVKAFVDAANAALTEIATQSKVKDGAVAAGPLVGDSAVRGLRQQILSAFASGYGALGGESLKDVGISLSQGGQIKFDQEAFTAAYTADPAKAQSFFDSFDNNASVPVDPSDPSAVKANDAKFQPGWDTGRLGIARKLEAIALVATEGVTMPTDPPGTPKQGVLEGLIKRRNDSIKNLNDQVAQWDTRLELRRTVLQRQFSSLEVAMGKMQQQSSWLAGQLSSLPTYS